MPRSAAAWRERATLTFRRFLAERVVWQCDRVRLNRPDYLLQPTAIVRRATIPYAPPGEGRRTVVTPAWGMPLEARSDESLGYSLITTRVFDLPVTETLLRLADPGELAIDVGANLGCMTSALAAAVGPSGEVWAFEPSPEVLPTLERNAARWRRRVRVFSIALSDHAGQGSLVVPVDAANGGLASFHGHINGSDRVETVETRTLDELAADRVVGVLKIDAERHEPQILAGAANLIAQRRVRDVIYEDVHGYPSSTSRPLTDAGYTVFALGRSFLRPRLDPPHRVTAGQEEQSYLATSDPDRAIRRMRRFGWRCL
jgi:FkbM family methyltransferase